MSGRRRAEAGGRLRFAVLEGEHPLRGVERGGEAGGERRQACLGDGNTSSGGELADVEHWLVLRHAVIKHDPGGEVQGCGSRRAGCGAQRRLIEKMLTPFTE